MPGCDWRPCAEPVTCRMEFDFEMAVIGGGSAGYAAARTGAAAGLRTVVIEGGREVGGLCILRGCMPTKVLLHSAEVLHLARHSGPFGVRTGPISFDWTEMLRRKDRLIDEFASYRRAQLESKKFAFLRATATFTDPHTVLLSTGETLRARHFVLATGSTVSPAPLAQLDQAGFITSDEALFLERLPQSLIILGGGPVAVEFAQFFARLGVRVTLVQRSTQLLKEEDRDTAETIETVFQREGITVFTGTRLLEAFREGDLKGVSFEHRGHTVRVLAEEIFHGLGRVPNIQSLALEKAGVQVSQGRFHVDAGMRTNVPHIFGAGDCTGLHEIVHLAIQHGEIAAHNIAHPDRPRVMDDRLLTSVIFTEPQIGRVGLTEKEATARQIPFLAASYPFADHGKSILMGATDGFVKLLCNPVSGEILGGCCAGPSGGELIHEIIAAMARRMTVQELAAMPHYHPTLAEIWTYPAEELAVKVQGEPA